MATLTDRGFCPQAELRLREMNLSEIKRAQSVVHYKFKYLLQRHL